MIDLTESAMAVSNVPLSVSRFPLIVTQRSRATSHAVLTLYYAGLNEQQIVKAQQKSGNQKLALRVSVESGGCHGYQYKMEVTDLREEDD